MGLLGSLLLIGLPGCWVSFGLRVPGLSVPTRLACGVAVSPLIVALQFYALRLLGVPFTGVAVLLPVANAPAAWLIFRHLRSSARLDGRQIALWTAVLLLPAAFLFVWLHDPQVRANWGHAWTHSDIIYMLANGAIRPEEPQLAGVGLAYPWTSHILQGLSSFLIGTPPGHNYVWTNSIWLVSTFVLVAVLTRELGGNRVSQATAVLWLCFAVNAVGYSAEHLLPSTLVERYSVWGDWRYTPWIRKFGIFEPTVLGIGMFAALAVLLCPRWPADWRKAPHLLVLLTLCALGITYPILFPAGLSLIGAKLITIWLLRKGKADPAWRRHALLLIAVALVSGLITLASVSWITADRTAGQAVGLSSFHGMKLKAATAVVVMAPLWLGLLAFIHRAWGTRRAQTAMLVLGGLGATALYVFVDVFNWRNEYKYIFAAAVCLAPFPALAIEPILARMGRWAALALALIALLLAAPAAHKMYSYPPDSSSYPILDLSSFNLRLGPGSPYREVCDAIRTETPRHSVLVARRSDIDLVTVTQRPMYVPYEPGPVHGLGLDADYLLKRSRGYDPNLVDERRAIARGLFDSRDPSSRADALEQLRDLGRPLAIIVEERENPELSTWLRAVGAIEIEEHSGITAWLVQDEESR